MTQSLLELAYSLYYPDAEFAKNRSRLKGFVGMRAKKGAKLGALLGAGVGTIGGVYSAKARNPNASLSSLLGYGVAGGGLGALTQGSAGAAIYGGGAAIRYGSRKLSRKLRKKR